MLTPELVKKIKQIQIYSLRMVNASFAGQYESVFKGRGMEFNKVREYVPGDDIRSIDWNVTARTGKPYIKNFVEEREMTVMFAVDLSASGDFGTVERVKNELAAEFCAVLAFAATRNNDKVGLVIFTDRIELFIPPKKGSKHVLRLIRELLYFKMPRRRTDVPMAVEYLQKVIKKKATVFLVSDFIATNIKKPLALLNKRHDVVAVAVEDRAERGLKPAGLVEFEDAETGQVRLVDTSSAKFRKRYSLRAGKRRDELERMLRSIKVDSINIATDRPYIQDVVRFFHMRHRRQ
ncbi:MAG TPA: DUF58 domain-containing protein [Phycisphaerales bacterium]|nr:DUF58 domain-containing protein [Phycisphaerales bacterium]